MKQKHGEPSHDCAASWLAKGPERLRRKERLAARRQAERETFGRHGRPKAPLSESVPPATEDV